MGREYAPPLISPIDLAPYAYYRAEHLGGCDSDEQFIIAQLLRLRVSDKKDMQERIMRVYSRRYQKISTSPTPGLLVTEFPQLPESTSIQAVGFARRECNLRLFKCIYTLNNPGSLPYAPRR